ncbi:hypothetical protein D3C79_1014710 [compost metagenome]
MCGQGNQRLLRSDINLMMQCRQCQYAIDRTGIQQTPTKGFGQRLTQSTFACATWSINGYHRSCSRHFSLLQVENLTGT